MSVLCRMIDITEFKKIMQLMRKRNKEEISETGKRLATRKSLDSPQNVKLLKYLEMMGVKFCSIGNLFNF